MSKQIDIEHKLIRVVSKITIDGKVYPLHRRNQEVAEKYEATQDEKVLDGLVDFSLDLGGES